MSYNCCGREACRGKILLNTAVAFALRYLSPFAMVALACFFFRQADIQQEKHRELEAAEVRGVITAMDKYNQVNNRGSKTESAETLYRMMVKTDQAERKEGMKGFVAVDNVAWETYARKKVGDRVCFRLTKSDAFPGHKPESKHRLMMCVWAAFCVIAVVGAMVFAVGMFACDGDEIRRYIRGGKSGWYAYFYS